MNHCVARYFITQKCRTAIALYQRYFFGDDVWCALISQKIEHRYPCEQNQNAIFLDEFDDCEDANWSNIRIAKDYEFCIALEFVFTPLTASLRWDILSPDRPCQFYRKVQIQTSYRRTRH